MVMLPTLHMMGIEFHSAIYFLTINLTHFLNAHFLTVIF